MTTPTEREQHAAGYTHVELLYPGGARVLASVDIYCAIPADLVGWMRARLLTRRDAIRWMARRRRGVMS